MIYSKYKFVRIGSPRLRAACAGLLIALCTTIPTLAEDVSSPAILQLFEARWDTIDDRMADIFNVGYGRMWVPPPARGGSVFSVGYDTFDRFDLGRPRDETHYGTAAGFRSYVESAHAASVSVNPDLIWNHNGVGNRTDPNFVELGGYPGFALTLPGDVNGDYHDPFIDALSDDEILGQLAGLNDIAQEKNHQFIRHPIAAGNPNNIPAGTQFNQPDPNNARFYPDQDLGGTTVFDARLGTNVTLYDFNASDPLAGDPVLENSLGLLMRNVRWMIQEYDIDGFRLDAARHFPRYVLDYFDQASFLAKTTPYLDGSPQHIYSFIETGFDNPGFLQDFIRRDIDNGDLGQVGGNRDVLDFRLFNRLKDNLTGNGLANNWHGVRGASMDLNDDGLINGSQGVAFVQSHDETGAFLANVAHAYTLMLPGESLVYLNAREYGDTGTFPQPGKDDALGGHYGETITKLVGLRNSHGRGDFRERWIDEAFGDNNGNGQQDSTIYMYERSNSALVALSNRGDGFVETRSGVQTDFAPGEVLVELTGNAADPTVDPGGTIPDALRVDGAGKVDVSIPGNAGHGRGYVIYGLATPEGSLSLTNVAATLGGATPTAGNNGTARLADIDVIHADSFAVELNTTPVTLPAPAGESNPVRDTHADGDTAMLRIDGGIDLNNLAGVDHTTPGGVSYGFEEFTDVRVPGYIDNGSGGNSGTGSGTYSQIIDATQLAEGRHYITTRAFRHRDSGPAVFTEFKRTVYIDRLPPEAAVVSFEPYATSPNVLQNRDLIVESTDGTADNMHLFLDLPAGLTDAEVIALALSGQQDADEYDKNQWIAGQNNVKTGNHVATVVTFEPSYDGTHGINVQRFPGLFTDTGVGAGFGDMDGDGIVKNVDLAGAGNNSMEDILYSQNAKFNAAADVDGNGLVDNRDLFALEGELTTATPQVLDTYNQVLVRRGNLNGDGFTNKNDVAALYDAFGSDGWLEDLNVDGTVDLADVTTLVADVLRTSFADFDLDQDVDGADYFWLQRNFGITSGARFDHGDANPDGAVDAADIAVWQSAFGFQGPALSALLSEAVSLPEPSTLALLGLGLFIFNVRNVTRGGTP